MTTIIEEKKPEQGEYLDPYSIFKYAMNSPVTRDRYTTRLDRFFSFIGVEGANIEERCRIFVQNAKKDDSWAFRNVINFLQIQKDRVERKEITGSTVSDSDEHQKEESKEPDYDEDKDQLEEEQEEETGEMTTNQVF